MTPTHRSIVIVLLMVPISTTSPVALARNPEVVEEFASLTHRVLRYLSNLKTVTDFADNLDNIIRDRAAGECRDTPMPGMNDRQCAQDVTHFVKQGIEASKQKCPHLSPKERMTSDIDCFGIEERLLEDWKDQCEKGTAPPWLLCNALAPR